MKIWTLVAFFVLFSTAAFAQCSVELKTTMDFPCLNAEGNSYILLEIGFIENMQKYFPRLLENIVDGRKIAIANTPGRISFDSGGISVPIGQSITCYFDSQNCTTGLGSGASIYGAASYISGKVVLKSCGWVQGAFHSQCR